MSTFVTNREIFVESVSVHGDSLTIQLDDGRSLTVPLTWYPRLLHGSDAERANHELIGNGEGIHWPDLDEDISVESLIAGRPSAESDVSLGKWLKNRSKQL